MKNIIWIALAGVLLYFVANAVKGPSAPPSYVMSPDGRWQQSGAQGEANNKQQKRDVISLCWQDQGKKSLAPDQARVFAEMCERL